MTPDRWEEVKAIFAEALDLPEEQRASWIQSCTPDSEVAEEALRLLREHEVAGSSFLNLETRSGGLLDRAARVLAASVSQPATPGAIFSGRYEVIRELGSGGSGIVYLAQDQALHNRPVVLKFLFPGGESHDRLSQRFRLEIEALARIRHPGVVGALDVGNTADGRVFLVMEYVEGETLRSEMDLFSALPQVASLISEIAEALTAAHLAGILHRDLKPENVMVQQIAGGRPSVKLIDFGIAKVQYSDPGEPMHTVTFVGTIHYVAPEQLMGKASIASDVYALGIIAYEMLTGRRPFDPETPFALYELQKAAGIAPPSRFRPEISQAADRAVLRALSFDPAARQASAKDFANELSAGLARRASKLFRNRRAVVASGALAAIASSFLLMQSGGLRAPSSIITTVAGAPPARLGHLQGIVADPAGNLYISATTTHQILKLTSGPAPRIRLIAGNGRMGFAGDGGDPASAELNNPIGLALDTSGDLYIVDQNNFRIRKVAFQANKITTVVGTGVRGYAGDGGDPKNAQLASPFGIAFDASGILYIGDQGNNRVRAVRFGANPSITTVAGSGTDGFSGDGGDPGKADLSAPSGLAFDRSGNLYFSDEHNNRIRKIVFAPRPTISTVVGDGTAAFSGDGGDPMSAALSGPQGIAIDAAGILYIADYENHRIRRVTFGPKRIITTVAGTGIAGFGGDGAPANAARLSLPTGVAAAPDGDIYIADYLNDRIRKVAAPSR